MRRSVRFAGKRQNITTGQMTAQDVFVTNVTTKSTRFAQSAANVRQSSINLTGKKIQRIDALLVSEKNILARKSPTPKYSATQLGTRVINYEGKSPMTPQQHSLNIRSVCHGSQVSVERPRIVATRYTKDFGPGFYCTVLHEQAVRWAVRFTGRGWLSHFAFRPDPSLDTLTFPAMSEEWLDFVVACRHGDAHLHDMVEGPVANDTIYNYVQDFIDGKISRAAFWELAKFKRPTHQICFCTERALRTLTFERAEEVFDE